jgi:hypothetical protein
MFNPKILYLTGILLLSCLAANAQAGFRPGYIIKNNGDTLNGLVFYNLDSRLKRGCRFKRFEILREVTYDPAELLAFGFRNGRHFESKANGKRKAFYECLIKGPVNLYCLPGKPDGQLFIDHASAGFMKLSKDMSILKDLTGISVDSVKYNAGSITALIRESASQSHAPVRTFYQTSGVNWLTDYSAIKANSLWTIGITGGYQFLKIDIPGGNLTRYFEEADYNSSYRPAAGIFINRRLSKKSDLASVDLSFLYLSDKYYGYAEYTTLSECRDYISLDFSAFQVHLSLKFMFGKQKYHPYVKAGVYGSFLFTSSYNRFAERQFGPEIFTERYSDYHLNNDWGIQGIIGIEIPLGHARNISFETGYMRGSQLLIYSRSFYTESVDSKVLSKGFSMMLSINL